VRKNTLLFIAFLTLLAGLGLFFRFSFVPFYNASQMAVVSPSPSANLSATSSASSALEIQVAQKIATLSPEQKISDLILVPVTITNAATSTYGTDEVLPFLKKWQPAGVTLFGSRIASKSAQLATQQLRSQLPQGLIAVDHEGGKVQRLNGAGFTQFPDWKTLCGADPDQVLSLWQASAKELKTAGVTTVLGPVVDVAASQSAMQKRACATTQQASESAEIFIKAFQSQQIETVLKHFPGIGSSRVDSHQQYDQISIDPNQLQIFQALIQKGLSSQVMTSHVGLASDPVQRPCSLNAECVNVLRSFGPSTIVFSDALEMTAATHSANLQSKTLSQTAQEALSSGNDLLLFGPSVSPDQLEVVLKDLLAEYNNSAAFRRIVDQHLTRLFTHSLTLKKERL
jgi:beta-N-acetylhexosaminidase